MPQPLTAEQRTAFLQEPHVAVMSVATSSGHPPYATPIWYAYDPDADRLLIMTFTEEARPSRKVRLLRDAGQLSLCMQREEQPYKYVAVAGTVEHVDMPATVDQILPIVRRYLPEEMVQGFYAMQTAAPGRVCARFVIRPDHWDSLDFAEG
jgi:nitroimidazol reductase NimA-like FMN-containing flavoprotein (pyridoxamine 5'-phosphate oxidase superfamily)